MTPRAFAYEALSYILISGGANPNATIANATTRQLERIASDLTATVQDVYRDLPKFFRRPEGGTLLAPQSITLAVTNASSAVTYGGTIINGSTILIEGKHYQIFTEAGAKRLDAVFHGSTNATASATLYGDALAISTDVSGIVDDVFIRDGERLIFASNRKKLLSIVRESPDYGRSRTFENLKPLTGIPCRYMVETGLTNETTGRAERSVVRVSPMPTSATGITYSALLAPPVFVVADLGTDGADATKTLVFPDSLHESILRPLFLAKFAKSPWFKDNEARKLIRQDELEALAKITELKKAKGNDIRFTPTI